MWVWLSTSKHTILSQTAKREKTRVVFPFITSFSIVTSGICCQIVLVTVVTITTFRSVGALPPYTAASPLTFCERRRFCAAQPHKIFFAHKNLRDGGLCTREDGISWTCLFPLRFRLPWKKRRINFSVERNSVMLQRM